jgi:peptidoglycan hydrolase-like protein with peptidoglycan-binding domain
LTAAGVAAGGLYFAAGTVSSAQDAFVGPLRDFGAGHPTQPTASRFDEVLAVQRLLDANGYYVGEINGRLSEETAAAIRSFQRLNFMRVDGDVSVSLITFLALHAVDNMEDGDREDIIEASSTSEDDDTEFDPRSRAVVSFVQRVLTRTGFSPGRVDGVYTVGTQQAIRDFQSRVDIDVTGTIDAELISALVDFEDTVRG